MPVKNTIEETHYSVLEDKNEAIVECPHCKSETVVKNGHSKGVQHYICKTCSKSFVDDTGKSTCGMHKKELYGKFVCSLMQGKSLRDAAKETNVSLSTAHAWKTKFMASLEDANPENRNMVIESKIVTVPCGKGKTTIAVKSLYTFEIVDPKE